MTDSHDDGPSLALLFLTCVSYPLSRPLALFTYPPPPPPPPQEFEAELKRELPAVAEEVYDDAIAPDAKTVGRFLRARKGDVQAALKQYIEAAKWFKEKNFKDLPSEHRGRRGRDGGSETRVGVEWVRSGVCTVAVYYYSVH